MRRLPAIYIGIKMEVLCQNIFTIKWVVDELIFDRKAVRTEKTQKTANFVSYSNSKVYEKQGK